MLLWYFGQKVLDADYFYASNKLYGVAYGDGKNEAIVKRLVVAEDERHRRHRFETFIVWNGKLEDAMHGFSASVFVPRRCSFSMDALSYSIIIAII